MKTLNLNQMENLIGAGPCDSDEIVATVVSSSVAGALIGGPVGFVSTLGISAFGSLIRCGLSAITNSGDE